MSTTQMRRGEIDAVVEAAREAEANGAFRFCIVTAGCGMRDVPSTPTHWATSASSWPCGSNPRSIATPTPRESPRWPRPGRW